jgi:acetyltransferase
VQSSAVAATSNQAHSCCSEGSWLHVWTSRNGIEYRIRLIQLEDEPLIARFHEGLSEDTVYTRYFQLLALAQRTAHERLQKVCRNKPPDRMALVAEYTDPDTGEQRIAGVGRLSKTPEANEAEFALLVSDSCQGQGLGRELLESLVEIGWREGLKSITGEIMLANALMLKLSRRVGFRQRGGVENGIVTVELDLAN